MNADPSTPPAASPKAPSSPASREEILGRYGVRWRYADMLETSLPRTEGDKEVFEVPIEWEDGVSHAFPATVEQYREALSLFDVDEQRPWLDAPLPDWILSQGT